MKRKWVFVVCAFVLLPALFAGCSPVEGVLEVEVRPAEETSPAVPESSRQIALAFLSGVIDDRLQHLQWLNTPCTTADGLGGPPKCPAGTADGTSVEVFPLGGPEGHFADRASISDVLEFTVKSLYAVTRVSPDAYSDASWPRGQYALIFDRDVNDYPTPVTVIVDGGKVVRMDFGVGTPVSELLAGVPLDLVLVPPEDVEAWLHPGGE